MDYQKHYNQLIYGAMIRPYEGYTESHHIVPRCLGGGNLKSNLVRLSAKQHFVAHHLLFKIYGGCKLAHAWFAMCRVGKGQEERLVNSRMFGRVKTLRSRLLAIESRGEHNHFFGKSHSEESRAKMSMAQKRLRLWESRSEEHQQALLVSQRLPKTVEHKLKIGRKGMVMLQNIITRDIIRVDRSDIRVSSNEWCNPKKLNPEPKQKCMYCDVVTIAGNLKRWHNDNCKQRKYHEN